ncbi:protein FAM181B [Ambystoma mexicanum]|uniref:protein FAM181B n=1 Tax=Ambystoma mexicanum TaxID=8296 RepID=UPI0037E780FA
MAAVMNPHFLPFCFPGSLVDYEAEKSFEDGGLLEERESGEFKEAARDLLSFINSASSNIKLALDKPVKSRRKVNHRKYLQKQIKRCTGLGALEGARGQAPPPSPSPSPAGLHCRPPPKREQAQSSLQSKSLAALFDKASELRGEKCKKVPLRKRNLPPSFFTEPAQVAANGGPGAGLRDLERCGALRELERCGAEAADFFELLGTDYSGVVPEQEAFHGGGPLRIHPDLAAEHALYEPHPLLGGLIYPEPWSPCGASKRGQAGMGSLQPVYTSSPDSTLSSPVEELPPHLPAFAPFFGDCSLPSVSYDFTSGYSKSGYPAL